MKFFAKLVLLLTLCAAAFGQITTVTPTNFGTAAVGPKDNPPTSMTHIAKGSDGFLRLLITDQSGATGSLIFVHCLDTACTSTTRTTVYSGNTNNCINVNTAFYYSLSMYGDLPRIAIMAFSDEPGCVPDTAINDMGVGLIVCGDQDCVSHPLTYIEEAVEDGNNLSSITTSTDVTYVEYTTGAFEPHHWTANLVLSTCTGGSCGAGSVIAFADSRNGPCIYGSPLRLGTGNIPIIAYASSGNSGTVNTADCGSHLNVLHFWANGSDVVLNSNALGFWSGEVGGLDVDSSGKPTLATTTSTSFLSNDWHLSIFHCSDSACGSFTEVDYPWPAPFSSNGSLGAVNVSIAPDGFARIGLTYGTSVFGLGAESFLTDFMKCTNVDCSLVVTTTVVSNDSSHPLTPFLLSMYTGVIGGQVINNFVSQVATDCSAPLPTCSYTTASDVLYQIPESTPDFTITATPAVQALTSSVGNFADYTITIAPTGGFTGDVTLTLSPLPPEVFAVLTPSIVTGGTGTSDMTLTLGLAVAPGVYPVTITGTSGSLHHNATVTLVVYQQKPRLVSRKLIDLIGDNPGVNVPVRSKEGKIPFIYNLIENPVASTFNNQWIINTQMIGVSSPPLVYYAPVYRADPPAGAPPIVPLPAYIQPIVDTVVTNPSAVTIGTPDTNQGWFFIDSSFVSHFFNVQGQVTDTIAPDGSGYTLSAASSTTTVCLAAPCPTIIDTAGNVLANSNNVDPTYRGVVATFTDAAKVYLNAYFAGDTAQSVVYKDTMGQVVLSAAETNATSKPPNGSLPTNQYTYTDAGGTARRFTVMYGQFYQSTNFGCPGISEMPRTPAFLPVRVTLPDGSYYAMTYESTPGFPGDVTGRLATVRLPTGGVLRYSYGGGNNGVNCEDGSVPVLNKTTPDGGTWTYIHTLN